MRLLALRDEWKPTLPGIEEVLNQFEGAPQFLNRESITKYLDEIALLPYDENFEGVVWMTPLTHRLWAASDTATWLETYQLIIQFLFDIGFLGIRNRGVKFHYAFSSPGHAKVLRNLGPSTIYTIHPAFHSALSVEPMNMEDLGKG